MPKTLSEPNEDYLERIYELMKEKGYVRVTDVADKLSIKPASVTKMLQKLAKSGHIKREAYRGFTLTKLGEDVGKKVQSRHQILYKFLKKLKIPEKIIKKDIEGMEHHLSDITLSKIKNLSEKI